MADSWDMRLFVGLDVPADIIECVESAIGVFRRAAPTQGWSPAANLHITTKFIGEWPEARLDELKSALASIHPTPFEVHIGGFGWFPNPHAPRIFWTAVKGGEALVQLAAATDEATAQLGVAKEKHAYTPHLTLARVTAGTDLRALRATVAGLVSTDCGRFSVTGFHLYRSDSGPAGSVYTKLAGFPFMV